MIRIVLLALTVLLVAGCGAQAAAEAVRTSSAILDTAAEQTAEVLASSAGSTPEAEATSSIDELASLAAPRAQVPVSADEVVRGDRSRPWMSLIFNAGAGYEPSPEILDTLAERGVRTTFFLMGWWAERNPELVQRIASEHEVASHGHEVFDLRTVSNAAVAADLERADEVISGITGRTTRPLWSASASARDARVNGIAASLGYRPIFWTADGGDWTFDATAEGVMRRVLDDAGNGAIIVLHLESPRTRTSTAVVLPALIDILRERGYHLVTITELVTGILD
jgi:peptidoglycan/xylan/chitin deacetylase (PgdA/CDA1 family)